MSLRPLGGMDIYNMTKHLFRRVDYSNLNPRQKENYNFQKISAVLAEYGFVTHRLSDDWQGAGFIAQHIDGETFYKVQLKSRLTFAKKYQGKDLFIAFQEDRHWYLFPHDELLEDILENTKISRSKSWRDRGGYSFPRLSQQLKVMLRQYRIA